MSDRRLIINAFASGAATHLAPGQWRNPDEHANTGFTDLEYWLELARVAEDAKFDALFLADSFGIPDSIGGSPDHALRLGGQVPKIDPFPVVAALASHTTRLGFGVTASTTYESPFSLARRLASLDHLSKGRIGWNIVTSATAAAAKNFGLDAQVPHDERYDRAQEFLDAAYRLWEDSWEDDAFVRDAENEIFVDPAKVHRIDYEGRWHRVAGPFDVPPSPQRTPLLFQAGASPRGQEFAGHNAEVVFTGGASLEGIRRTVDRTRAQVVAAGRPADSVKFVTQLTVITAASDAEARDKREHLRSYASEASALAILAGWTGIDWTGHDLDAPVAHVETEGMRSALANISGADGERPRTLREAARDLAVGGQLGAVVGGPETVARRLVEIAEHTGVDGFNLVYTVSPGSFADFAAHVVPVLQEQGRMWADYPDGTLRERLLGSPRLAAEHRGRRSVRAVPAAF